MKSSHHESGQITVAMPTPSVVGSLVLLVSFFLPWIQFLGINVAGNEISKLSDRWVWLWIIPVLSGVAAGLGFAGRRHVAIAQLAGGLPLIALVVSIMQNGSDIFSIIRVGGWVALLSGIFLLCVAPRIKAKAKSQAIAVRVDNT